MSRGILGTLEAVEGRLETPELGTEPLSLLEVAEGKLAGTEFTTEPLALPEAAESLLAGTEPAIKPLEPEPELELGPNPQSLSEVRWVEIETLSGNVKSDLNMSLARDSIFGFLGNIFFYKCKISPQVQFQTWSVFIKPVLRSGLSALPIRPPVLKTLTTFHNKVLRAILKLNIDPLHHSTFYLVSFL